MSDEFDRLKAQKNAIVARERREILAAPEELLRELQRAHGREHICGSSEVCFVVRKIDAYFRAKGLISPPPLASAPKGER